MLEKDTRIQSPELAEEMAYAEAPFRKLAIKAMGRDRSEDYDNFVEAANVASNIAGRNYLAQLSLNLSYHESDINPEIPLDPFVNATEQDMIDYALQCEDPIDMHEKMRRIWTALKSNAKKLAEAYPGQFVIGPNPRNDNNEELLGFKLTQALVDNSAKIRNIGVKKRDILQAYFDTRINSASE